MHPLELARQLVQRFALPSGDRDAVLDGLDRLCEHIDVDIRCCRDCNGTFIQTQTEQEYYLSRDLVPPVRCRSCRDQRRAGRPVSA